MEGRVSVILEISTGIPGRWKTISLRLIGNHDDVNITVDKFNVVVIAADHAVDIFEEGLAAKAEPTSQHTTEDIP